MAEQGELLSDTRPLAPAHRNAMEPATPRPEASMLDDLNHAKALAFEHATDAVRVLADVVTNPDMDLDLRVQAAAELLQFAAKGPF